MKKFISIIAIGSTVLSINILAQVNKDKGVFIEYKNEFMDTIKAEIKKSNSKPDTKKPVFKVDFSNLKAPQTAKEFKQVFHTPPVSQGITGTCWSYAGTSFFESEFNRLYKKEVKLSEMFTVYCEYIEKAKRFIKERGNSAFGEGGHAHGPLRILEQYGSMPHSAYTGLLNGQKFHNHETMFKEMNDFLQNIKKNNAWNEDFAVETIKSIMNNYMGKPPIDFEYNGTKYNAVSFSKEYLKLNPDDYFDFISLMEHPYFKKSEYQVEDNWRKDSTSYNVPLDIFMKIVKESLRKGYSFTLGGDVSEAGMESHAGVAIVPSFDIPSEYIDENARQFRFSNKSTTDDHGIHAVGVVEKDGEDWFLIKDSGSGAKNNGKHWGYYFFHEDYIKLKMMDVLIHKSAVEDILKKF